MESEVTLSSPGLLRPSSSSDLPFLQLIHIALTGLFEWEVTLIHTSLAHGVETVSAGERAQILKPKDLTLLPGLSFTLSYA